MDKDIETPYISTMEVLSAICKPEENPLNYVSLIIDLVYAAGGPQSEKIQNIFANCLETSKKN